MARYLVTRHWNDQYNIRPQVEAVVCNDYTTAKLAFEHWVTPGHGLPEFNRMYQENYRGDFILVDPETGKTE